MENKNTQADKSSSLERNELHNTIWKVANELRGSVDGWDFKQYVLGILFYRYISENMTHYINKEKRKHDPSFDYALLSDEYAEGARKGLIEEKGFYIPPSALFCNVLKNAHNNEDLNVTLQNIFNEIEKSSLGFKSEENVKGLFADLDVNSNKLGSSHKTRVGKLTKILEAIGDMQLGDYQKSGIDVFGDAYEYLMTIVCEQCRQKRRGIFHPPRSERTAR
ncbi:hypothetical protein HpMS172_13580 [Helicobacter pylori]